MQFAILSDDGKENARDDNANRVTNGLVERRRRILLQIMESESNEIHITNIDHTESLDLVVPDTILTYCRVPENTRLACATKRVD